MAIEFFIMDVDGTLTDGKIYMGDSGELIKVFNVKDGYGIHDILSQNKIKPVIITGRESEIVSNRCKELGITDIYQGVSDKLEALASIADFSKVAYIGDDINDLPVMLKVQNSGGIVGVPKDAVKSVRDIADFIAEHNGGEGAVRDFIDWLLEENKFENDCSYAD